MHPSTANLLHWLNPNVNLPEPAMEVAKQFHDLAHSMVDTLPEGPELTAGLRHLLEAKDCMVRAAL